MKWILLFMLMHTLGVVHAQQNLIPNGSFEHYRQEVFDNLLNVETSDNVPRMVTSHFDEPLTSLFNGWKFEFPVQGNNDGVGILFGIVPNLYSTYGGTDYLDFPRVDYFTDIDGTDERVLSAETSTLVGLRLQPNVYNGLSGFDCSPPNTLFGSNVTAPNGDNYVALIDFKHNGLGGAAGNVASAPAISVKLCEPLVKDKKYVFVITRAQMNQLGVLANASDYNSVNAELEVHVGMSDFTPKQEIFKESFSNNDWETIIYIFEANKAYTNLRVRFNPINYTGTGSKISGCFIDNLKLYELCETPLNQCNNQNYRSDLLDVDLKKTDKGDPLAYPDPHQGNKDHLETIKATNLENVKHLEMWILEGIAIKRTIILDFPPTEVIWDGRDDFGNPMPEGNYKAFIKTVSNDCYSLDAYKTKTFQLRRKYTTFNNIQIATVPIQTVSGDGIMVPAITGLDNVHWMNLRVFDIGWNLVYEENFYNPPSEMLLSTYFGNINGVPQSLSTGEYHIKLLVSNNCQSSLLGNNWDHTVDGDAIIANFTQYNVSDPSLFNWVFTPKPNAECPFEHNYQDNYLSPRDCCEGNLYIQDVDIHNDFVVNIQQNIYFGPNVSFGNDGYNTFLAGNSIYVDPGMTIPLGADVYLIPNVNNCMTCIQAPNGTPTIEDYDQSSYLNLSEEKDPLSSTITSGLYPNPVQAGSVVNVTLLKESANGQYTLLLLDGLGKEYSAKILERKATQLEVRLPQNLSTGIYYLKVATGDMVQTFRINIRN